MLFIFQRSWLLFWIYSYLTRCANLCWTSCVYHCWYFYLAKVGILFRGWASFYSALSRLMFQLCACQSKKLYCALRLLKLWYAQFSLSSSRWHILPWSKCLTCRNVTWLNKKCITHCWVETSRINLLLPTILCSITIALPMKQRSSRFVISLSLLVLPSSHSWWYVFNCSILYTISRGAPITDWPIIGAE